MGTEKLSYRAVHRECSHLGAREVGEGTGMCVTGVSVLRLGPGWDGNLVSLYALVELWACSSPVSVLTVWMSSLPCVCVEKRVLQA